MRRLLILEAIATIAGGQRVLLDLLPGLREAFDVTVAIPGPGPLADALRAQQVATVMLPIRRYSLVKKTARDVLAFAASTPRLSLALRALIRRDHIDLLYANSAPAFPWGTLGAVMAGRPILWHSHNNLGDGKSLLLARALATLPAVRQIIGASASAVNQLRQPAKSVVVRSGVDLELFKPSAEARQRCRAQLNIPPDAPLFGVLGDFIPLKGHDVFLRAAAEVRTHQPEVRIVVVGAVRPNAESQSFRDSLAPRLQETGARVMAWPEDLTALLNALDVAVVASTTETGPLALFQALACGVPVMSTPVGHAPSLLTDGTAGRLFPIGDAVALTALLRTWLESPEMHIPLQEAARQIAVAELDLKNTRRQVVELIERSAGIN
jgi:glycosyltransferase involved in cell wall biosynthesis